MTFVCAARHQNCQIMTYVIQWFFHHIDTGVILFSDVIEVNKCLVLPQLKIGSLDSGLWEYMFHKLSSAFLSLVGNVCCGFFSNRAS